MCSQAIAAQNSEEEEVTSPTESSGEGEKRGKQEDEEDDEEIPQLVAMATPSKKPKLQVSPIVWSLISYLIYF